MALHESRPAMSRAVHQRVACVTLNSLVHRARIRTDNMFVGSPRDTPRVSDTSATARPTTLPEDSWDSTNA